MRRSKCARRAKSGSEQDADILIDAADDGFGGDGQGQIQWGGLNPAGSYEQKPDSVTEWGDTDWSFEFVGNRETGGLLTIIKAGGRITLNNFDLAKAADAGILGLKLEQRTRIEIVKDTIRSPVPSAPPTTS